MEASRNRLQVASPATGATLGTVLAIAPAEVAGEVRAARAVQPLWALLRPADRARYVRTMAQALIDGIDQTVEIVASEQGRPAAEVAALEALPAIDALIWTAEQGVRELDGQRVRPSLSIAPLRRARVEQEPLGAVAVIGSGAAPLAEPLSQIAAALMAGNAVLCKPGRGARLAGERIAEIVARAGLPEGLVRVLHGDGQTAAALAQADVDHVLFTGSDAVGANLAATCASRGRRAQLARTGGDAMLVLADADLDRALAGALWAGNVAAGQARGAVERICVARELHGRFVARLAAGAAALQVGDPSQTGVQVGPLRDRESLDRLDGMVAAMVAGGATLHCGGPLAQTPCGCDGAFYAPAVITDLPAEIGTLAGPVVCVRSVETVQQAIDFANAVPPGLGVSLWTADRHRALRIAREMDAPTVWCNDHFTRTLTPERLRACARERPIAWQPPALRGLWWGPYGAQVQRAAKAAARLRSAREADRSRAWRAGAVAMARVGARALARR